MNNPMDDFVYYDDEVMKRKESINKLISKVIVELVTMSRKVYDEAKKKGFNDSQAMTLAAEYMRSIMSMGMNKGEQS